jgi:pyridoxal phosphate enzyme (YggS family)
MDLAANLSAIQSRMRAACDRAGRAPETVTLLAVAKHQPPEAVSAVAALGVGFIGENRVQEARLKIPQCPGRLRWHMIGHLQTNKVCDAVELFTMIESVDSLRLAEEISKRAALAAKTIPILLEVNVAGEASKFGYPPARLLEELLQLNGLPRIELHGLMCVPPAKPLAEQVRPFFRELRELKTRCEEVLGASLPHLSMGMSGDFEVAIEEGATLIRVGTALFGARSYPARADA